MHVHNIVVNNINCILPPPLPTFQVVSLPLKLQQKYKKSSLDYKVIENTYIDIAIL